MKDIGCYQMVSIDNSLFIWGWELGTVTGIWSVL